MGGLKFNIMRGKFYNLKEMANRRFKHKQQLKIAINIWNSCSQIYFNGSHSDYEYLSLYYRPDDRNNQALEGAHRGSIALGAADIGDSARGTFKRWLNTAKREEVLFAKREFQINHFNSEPKKKDADLIKKDKAIKSIVNQHKRNEISAATLLKEYILKTNDKILPRNIRHYSSHF